MRVINIGGAALNQTPLDWENNLKNIKDVILDAKNKDISLLCLPELCICGYGCEDLFFNNAFIERCKAYLLEIVVDCTDITIAIGLPVLFQNNLYNAVCLIQNTKIIGFVPKQKLCGDGVHYEPRWFKGWPAGIVEKLTINQNNYPIGDLIFSLGDVHLAIEICEDSWIGIRPIHKHLGQNIDIILNASASHFEFGKSEIRQRMVLESSRAYFCTYLYTNLLGNESGKIIFDGEILISQNGKLLCKNKRFSYQNYNLGYATIDIEESRIIKRKSFTSSPDFKNQESAESNPDENKTNVINAENISSYLKSSSDPAKKSSKQNIRLSRTKDINSETESKEEEMRRAVALGLFDYLRKAKAEGFVISLSGGADSSACVVMVKESIRLGIEELGKDYILKLNISHLKDYVRQDISSEKLINIVTNKLLTCAYQSTKNSSKETFNSAKQLANSIGAEFFFWNLDREISLSLKKIEKCIGRKINWDRDDIPLQNIQARSRAPVIWMLANVKNALLLVTSNRSECSVGYATMDGDTAGGLAPLAGIDKHYLRKWLSWAHEKLGYITLDNILKIPPTAELKPSGNQTDENELMPYWILVLIEKAALEEYKSPLEVFQKLHYLVIDKKVKEKTLKTFIKKFYHLWSVNQWKRERFAPSFHLDRFNLDPKSWYRFPILNGAFKKELDELSKIKSKNF